MKDTIVFVEVVSLREEYLYDRIERSVKKKGLGYCAGEWKYLYDRIERPLAGW